MLVVVGVVVLEQVEQRALKHVLGETLLLDDLTERREIDGQLQKIKKKIFSPCQREREKKKKPFRVFLPGHTDALLEALIL